MIDSDMSSAPVSTFLIVDGHALIYRAYHAFPPLLDSHSRPAGAFFGFLRILLSVLKQVEPDCWLIAFDDPAPTKRRQAYDFYKANRPPMPEDLRPQIALIEQAVSILGAPVLQVPGIEADDIIGTISRQVCESGRAKVLILTGDKDSFQLVNDCIHVLVPTLGRRRESGSKQNLIEYNPALVEKKMLVKPHQIIDYKALAGDPSDNIPGVTGIGPKTAANLLHTFGSLDGIYQAIEQDEFVQIRSSVVAKLQAQRENAYISQELATIDQHVPDLDFNFDACKITGYNKEATAEFLLAHGFKSLIKDLPADSFDVGLQEALF